MDKYFLRQNGGIPLWDEGYPLGNGKLGCIVYGDSDLIFSVDRGDLWDKRVPTETQESGFTYQNQILTARENWAEHQRLFDNSYNHPYPTKISAGRIVFLNIVEKNTAFSLNMRTAEACVRLRNGNSFKSFICLNTYVGVISCPRDSVWEIQTPKYLSANEGGLGYDKGEMKKEGAYLYTVQTTKTELCFGLMIKEDIRGNRKFLYYTVWAGENKENAILEAKKQLDVCSRLGYQALFEQQKKYWENYYSLSPLSVGDETFDYYYLKTRYLFASASRQGGYPMPLQGVWTADNGELPPWKGDYHADLNMQMCYEAYGKAGLFEEGRVLCDYLWANRETYRSFAKKFYGVNGASIPGVAAIDGTPLGGWPMYALNPCMSAWLAKCFDEHYKYTQDEEFWRNRACPFFTEIGEAISELLILEEGKYRLPLSVSPEYNDGRQDAYLPSQSNFELAILKWLYKTLLGYAEKLGDKDRQEKYGRILDALKGYALDEKGALKICKEIEYGASHRHFSHLLAICPFHEFDRIKDGDFILKNIEKLEEYGTSKWIGFSFVAMAELCAYIGQGNRAYRYLRDYIEGFTAENGFHLNGDYKNYGYSELHYRPFTLEAVFGFSKALQEMLLGSKENVIYLFPSIPEKWAKNKITFTDLVAENGAKVSATYRNGKIDFVQITAKKDGEIILSNGLAGKTRMLQLKANESVVINDF